MALHPENSPSKHTRRLAGLSLCSGHGGLELGLTIAEPGYESVCHVERNAFCASALVARMEDKAMDRAPVWDDVKSFDGRPWRGKVDILTAGYPCQPFAASGSRKAEKDPRHLWPDVRRIAEEIQPEWIFCENVEGHLDRGLQSVLDDLARMDFEPKAGLFAAGEVGASHRRRRIFILAHANTSTIRMRGEHQVRRSGDAVRTVEPGIGEAISPEGSRTELDGVLDDIQGGRSTSGNPYTLPAFAPPPCDFKAWDKITSRHLGLEPCLYGLDHGMADRMERSEGAGNGVVPLAAAYAWRTLRVEFG